MAGRVVEDLVVDFVGKNDQIVTPGDFDNVTQQIIRIQCAGWIVGVDDNDSSRSAADFGLYLFRIR